MGGCVGWGVGQWASGHGWVGGWVDGWVHVWLCACGVRAFRAARRVRVVRALHVCACVCASCVTRARVYVGGLPGRL